MKNKIINIILSAATIVLLMTSCNKEVEQFPDVTPEPSNGQTLDQVLQATADYSLYYALVSRGGQQSLINDNSRSFTMFVPGNNGIKAAINVLSGGLVPVSAPDAVFLGFINSQISVAQAAAIVQYNTIPQTIRAASIPSTFPNFFYPSTLNPAPTLSALARLDIYPTTRNGAWVNNVPIVGVDIPAVNGVIHQTATVVVPSQRFLWERISTESDLTYLKAAILRADSGVAPGSRLQDYLSSFGPNFTVFAPVDTAFKSTLFGLIAQTLINNGVPPQIAIPTATQLSSTPNVFTNPLLASALTPQAVKGIVVYHVLGSRAFTNNFPTAETGYPTLLNTAIPTHPGLKLQATFTPPNPFVTSATVKDVYSNSPAANIFINAQPLTPDPYGTSDQNFVNGVLHKISKVLLPQ